MITKIHTKDHDAWLALRSQYLGGSDAASVVGLNPYTSPFALWAEKTGQKPPFEGNLATRTGAFLEEFVAKLFEEETGKKVRRETASLFNSDYPWAIANVDRLIVGEDAGLEIKTCSSLSTKRFKNGEFPANYYCQCTHYLAITGKSRWYLAVLIGNHDFRTFTIERDEDEIRALMDAECAFWRDYVTAKTPPPVDGMDPTDDTLKLIYPESDGSEITLFNRDSLLDRYFDLEAQIKALKADQDAIRQAIQLDMGSAETAVADRYKVTWKTQTRTTFDAKKYTQDHPDLDLSPYWKQSAPTRAFRIYKTFKED